MVVWPGVERVVAEPMLYIHLRAIPSRACLPVQSFRAYPYLYPPPSFAQALACPSTGPRLTVVFLTFSVLAQGGGEEAVGHST